LPAIGAPRALGSVEPYAGLAGELDRHRYDDPMIVSLTLIAVNLLANAHGGHESSQERAKVMILGVYHFDSPNQDFVKSTKVDHLSAAKQDEIAEVLDRLAAFAPTRIVLEATPDDGRIQERYAAYLADRCELAGNEREQLGFRLARQFSHPRVYLADHRLDMDLNAVLAAAEESADDRFLGWFHDAMEDAQALAERQSRMSVREALLLFNEPALQDRTRDLYLQLARVRSPKGFVGSDVLAGWYRRNFCIFANVAGAIESAGDRVLVIFGQGHAPCLRELVRSSPDMQLVEPNEYLAK
jgi:hypothetical protein